MADGSQMLEGWKAAKDTAPKEAWNGMCFAADHRQMILEGSSVWIMLFAVHVFWDVVALKLICCRHYLAPLSTTTKDLVRFLQATNILHV